MPSATSDTPHPLFTGDDYQLVAEATYREEDRRELFRRFHGFDAPEDDHRDRLADLARRITAYIGHPGEDEPPNVP